ncbi:MAG: peptidylprolyl isomerase [Alphaproteobacteria bacterium]|nr:peptidylprolyl isomerase [Alphaproteobacteria bacterium]
MKITIFAALALICTGSAAWADDYVMLKVGNQDITATEVQRTWEGLFPTGSAPAFDTVNESVRQNVLRGIITEKLVMQEALKQNLDKNDAVLKEIKAAKNKIILRHFLDSKTEGMISDDAVKAEYDRLVRAQKEEKEIRARHILVADEKEAKELAEKIDDGESFEKMAKEFSKDPGTAKQGGDLGYFTKDKMVKEFAEEAFDLDVGEVSDPVKSPFGWHLIKVEDKRAVTVPTYNEAKDDIKMRLQEAKLNSYMQQLLKAADVTYFDAKGKQIPFDKDAAELKDNE